MPTVSTGVTTSVSAGKALVKGDTNTGQGFYLFECSASELQAHTRDATNPRINMLVARVNDSTEVGSGSDGGAIEIVAGTPTAGATLVNRSGAAALPASALWIADVLVPVTGNATITDKRIIGSNIIRGVINADGTIASGSGFSVSKVGVGQYSVTFSTAFSAVPAVTATVDDGNPGTMWSQGNTTTKAELRVFNTAGAAVDRGFAFIAILTA